jgi:hypothetical protein
MLVLLYGGVASLFCVSCHSLQKSLESCLWMTIRFHSYKVCNSDYCGNYNDQIHFHVLLFRVNTLWPHMSSFFTHWRDETDQWHSPRVNSTTQWRSGLKTRFHVVNVANVWEILGWGNWWQPGFWLLSWAMSKHSGNPRMSVNPQNTSPSRFLTPDIEGRMAKKGFTRPTSDNTRGPICCKKSFI